jgi:hypothetical protein
MFFGRFALVIDPFDMIVPVGLCRERRRRAARQAAAYRENDA